MHHVIRRKVSTNLPQPNVIRLRYLLKIYTPTIPPLATPTGTPKGGSTSPLHHPNPVHDLPLLRITDACGIKPISQLIGRPC